MNPDPHPLAPHDLPRRLFLQTTLASTTTVVAAASAPPVPPLSHAQAPASAPANQPAPEWRNRQSTMSYRRLGRTGLMVSEIVSGGDPISSRNVMHLELALELGLNYLDMAPAYGNGDCERAYGMLLAAAPGRREKVFIATKVSGYTAQRESRYREIFKSLDPEKQAALLARARELRAERACDQPGYFLEYYPGQLSGFDAPYLRLAMRREFGPQVESAAPYADYIVQSVEGSLKRLGTDYIDILHCPHGANAPEDLDAADIRAAFDLLKKQGKVRFLGVTSHNDPAAILHAAADAGHYDCAMIAYNVCNGGYVEDAIRHAASRHMGLIAMKSAHAVATHHKSLQPIPAWRIAKVDRIVPGDLPPPLKAYLWSLQNPHITAVVSNLWDEAHIRQNLALAGQKVQLQPA